MRRSATTVPKRSVNRTLIVAAVVITLGLAIAIIAAKPGTAPRPAASAASPSNVIRAAGPLTARETSFDFGSVSMAAGNVSHRYWFRNEGTTPVLLRRIYTSCMCTTATLVKGARIINRYGMPGHGPLPSVNETLAPGEAAYVEAIFDPAAHGPAGLGRTERVVTIESDSGRPLELRFSADVRP